MIAAIPPPRERTATAIIAITTPIAITIATTFKLPL